LCCDGQNLWRVRLEKWCFGLGAGYSGGGSVTIGDPKNCPNGYEGTTLSGAIGPVSGDNTLGSEWSDVGIGPGKMIKIFVLCINKFTEPPAKVGCCKK